MATITLKNVPAAVHSALKVLAGRSKRSLDQEIIHCLEQALLASPRDPQFLLRQVRSLRARFPTKPVNLAWIDEAKRQGRR